MFNLGLDAALSCRNHTNSDLSRFQEEHCLRSSFKSKQGLFDNFFLSSLLVAGWPEKIGLLWFIVARMLLAVV
jgi:hypothetical protein